MTQQAVAKSTRELEELGYLDRTKSPADARIRLVGLTARGRDAMAAGRAARAAIVADLETALGPRKVATLRRSLLAALEATGGMEAVLARRVPEPG